MLKKLFSSSFAFAFIVSAFAQTNPVITEWLINSDGSTGRHYISGNSTPITNSYLCNVESVYYAANFSFISSSGIPSYIVGPYLDGNPSTASDNEHLFKIPLNPVEKTGTKTATSAGTIGLFINGVPMYDYRDAQSYNNQGIWNRDAVLNEMDGFDCAKGHPSPIFQGGSLVGGTYHHHQNPSAFDLDLLEVSDICDTYPADGLYIIDETEHSPLLGFALDGFPVYGAYGYANTDGSGGIKRIESGYALRTISVRTHYADGSDVSDGPPVNGTYPLGTYKEDYEYSGVGDLDEYNGRFAVTPEYPNGIYAYYATVDANHNSAFPYMIGPDEFYGEVTGGEVPSIPSIATLYLPIELLSFSASSEKTYTLVEWATSLEINNDYFTLEKSLNGREFTPIATIRGAGNSEGVQKYDFKDREELNGTAYYHLQQTDFDGTSTYTKIVSVQGEKSLIKSIKTFPNPATEFVAVQVGSLNRQDLEVKLFDNKGVLLQTAKIYTGSTICHFDVRSLYNGQYVVQVTDGLNVNTEKIVVLKE